MSDDFKVVRRIHIYVGLQYQILYSRQIQEVVNHRSSNEREEYTRTDICFISTGNSRKLVCKISTLIYICANRYI